jgi:xanthine/uracil permease
MEAGLSLAPLSLSMFAVALIAGKRAGKRSPGKIIQVGFLLLAVGVAVLIPVVPRAHSGWWMVVPLLIAGAGLGLLVSQLNNYTLSPIEEERVSEAAGVNSAGGSFGLSFGLAFAGAIMLASLSLLFTHYSDNSKVLSPAEQQQVSKGLGKERRGDHQHAPRSAARRPAARRPGRDHPHQHDRAASSAADRLAGPAPGRAARPGKRLPDDPAAGP